MSQASGNPGINKLANVMQGRINQNKEANSALLLDFGEIMGDYSLLTNTYPIPIPKSDYLVCRSVSWGSVDSVFYKTQYTGKPSSGAHAHGPHGEHPHGSSGEHGGHVGGDGAHGHPDTEGTHTHPAEGAEMEHVHDVLIGPKYRWIQPGDRVLVAWVQHDAIVIDIILPASSIG